MEVKKTPYDQQIFVCTNNSEGDESSCGDQKGQEVFRQLRKIAKEEGVHPRIRVAQATCLGKCSMGVNIMVYPENKWYSDVSVDDVKELAAKYLRGKGEKE